MSPDEITERLELLKTLRAAMTEDEIQAYLAKTYASDEASPAAVAPPGEKVAVKQDGTPDEAALKAIAENFYREHQGEPRRAKKRNRVRRLIIAVAIIVALAILAALAMQASLSNNVPAVGQVLQGVFAYGSTSPEAGL